MLGRALVRDLEAAFCGVEAAPVLALRCRRRDMGLIGFLHAFGMAVNGLGGFDVPRNSPRIRSRAQANRRANKVARTARRRNRA